MTPARRWQPWVFGILGFVVFALLWEGYKLVAPATGVVLGDVTILPRANDVAMPHIWTILTRAFEPVATWGKDQSPVWVGVAIAGLNSLGLAGLGWLLGVVVGLLLAMLMQRFKPAESALLPWIVLSQTVPLIAIAPLLKRWGADVQIGALAWEDWMSVVVIASYLAFFPVSVSALRGFDSAETAQVELLRAYGVGWWKTFLRVRLPGSVPHLLPALRLAATNAVIGVVVAENAVGLGNGIGRAILNAASSASLRPADVWVAVLGVVFVGLVAVGFVALLGRILRRYRRKEAMG